jgi:DNA transformation protein and related proteins
VSDESLIALVKERLAPLGAITVRKTFGELAVYVDKRLIGLILNGELYLKTDAESAVDYDARGAAAFSYEMNGKRVVTAYRQAPEEVYDDADEMLRRAGDAIRVVLAAKG